MSLATIKEMKPQRYIGKEYTQFAIKSLDNISGVVYLSNSETGNVFYAKAYTRKALHPKVNHYFNSAEKREAFVKQWIERLVEREDAKIAARAAKKAASHKLVIGSILNTSWGYDQTNVDYFQVVGIKSKTMVYLREIAQIQHDDSHVLPAANNFIGEQFAKRVNPNYDSVKISSCQTASPVSINEDGSIRPSYKTPWGYGH